MIQTNQIPIRAVYHRWATTRTCIISYSCNSSIYHSKAKAKVPIKLPRCWKMNSLNKATLVKANSAQSLNTKITPTNVNMLSKFLMVIFKTIM